MPQFRCSVMIRGGVKARGRHLYCLSAIMWFHCFFEPTTPSEAIKLVSHMRNRNLTGITGDKDKAMALGSVMRSIFAHLLVEKNMFGLSEKEVIVRIRTGMVTGPVEFPRGYDSPTGSDSDHT